MTTWTEDLCIMGTGVIGCITALLAARAGLKVSLCGPGLLGGKPGSASIAAGAMLNVFGEIDGRIDDYTERKLKIGTAGVEAWRKFLPPEVFCADQTEVYVGVGASDLEEECFKSIWMASGVALDTKPLEGKRCLILPDEPAIDTVKLFAWLENELRQTVRILPNNWWQSGQMSIARHTLWACGVWTPTALGTEKYPILPVFSGVGTAMVLKDLTIDVPLRTVVRTPNRGNTCGVHVIPRAPGEYYVGAGSFISKEPSTEPRLETIKYLTDCIIRELNADIWRSTITPVVGNRPVSFDGKPMLGPLKAEPSFYVATGTKRDGLTYAPVIADDVIRWATGTERTGVFDGWDPDRAPITFGPYGRDSFVANRVAAMASHGRWCDKQAASIEYDHACLRAREKYNLPLSYRLHPEIAAVM